MYDTCAICQYPVENSYELTCNDTFCKSCIVSYIEDKIYNNEHNIICPTIGCDKEIDYWIIKQLLSSYQFEKYEKMLLRHGVLNSNDMSFCPKCDSVCVKYENSNKTKCNGCYHKYCYICQNDWYKDHECDSAYFEEIIHDVKIALEENDVKACPKCRIIISRNAGCLAMTCTSCGIRFCWKCLRTNGYIKKHGHDEYEDCDGDNYRFDRTPHDSSDEESSESNN